MTVVGILGNQSRETARCLHEILESAAVAGDFSVIDLERETNDMPLDILVATGGSKIAHRIIDSQANRFFIMNPDQKDILAYASNSRGILITYGFNSKVCVTASSVMENEVQICVQRDLPTLSGGSVEQQEFGVSADTENNSPENLLAAITAALVAGVEVMVLN